MSFHWEPSLSVNAPEINQEHQMLIAIMNKIERSHETANNHNMLANLSQLRDYAQLHFYNEEAYMQAIAYPELESHKRVHQGILDKLDKFISQYEYNGTLGENFFHFLSAWVKTHMGKMDLEYAKSVNQ